jgi:lysophospholipase L1-like esterase
MKMLSITLSLVLMTLSTSVVNSQELQPNFKISESSLNDERTESFTLFKKKYLMASIGDSITAGIFSSIQGPISRGERSTPALTGLIENRYSFSWASGYFINSHYKRLDQYLQSRGQSFSLGVKNVAVSGEVYSGIGPQVDAIMALMKSGQYEQLKYVTVFIGNNDACTLSAETAVTEGKKAFEYLLSAFNTIQQPETIKILVVGLPKIYDLATEEIKKSKLLFGRTCEQFRDQQIGYCKNLLGWKTQSEYEAARRLVDTQNNFLREVVAAANSKYSNLEVVYSDYVSRTEVDKEFLSVDCFHPNNLGQEKISEGLWSEIPWFK